VRSASAMAADETELYVISKRNFKRLIMANPDFTLKLLQTLADRLTRADREIASMLFHNILGRLAEAVLELAKGKTRRSGESRHRPERAGAVSRHHARARLPRHQRS